MSELLTPEAMDIRRSVEEALNATLDTMLPYEPYKLSDLDRLLISEAGLDVQARWNALWEKLDDGTGQRKSKFEEFDIARRLYETEFPGATYQKDDAFISGVNGNLVSRYVLTHYGSLEANRPENRIREIENAQKFCRARGLTQAEADRYFAAVEEFEHTLLDEIRFCSEDEQLRIPLMALGNAILNIIVYDDASNKRDDWEKFLDFQIGRFDFLGENGEFMGDTEGLLSWVNDMTTELLIHDKFPDLSKWHYGQNGERWFDKPENQTEEELALAPKPECDGQQSLEDLLNEQTVNEFRRSVDTDDPTVAKEASAAHTIKVGGKKFTA